MDKSYDDIINVRCPTLKHPQMSLENRAKIFAPFDALRGFSLAILTKQAEHQLVSRITLSEDAQEQLDYKLRMVQPGNTVTVTYFRLERVIADLELGTYTSETGEIEEIDTDTGTLFLTNACVPIQEIIELESSIFSEDLTGQEVCQYDGPDQTKTVR